MIQLLWTILNIGILILFITICVKATRMIREKLGIFSAIIFAIGILSSLVSNLKTNHHNENWDFTFDDTIPCIKRFDIVLDKTLISSYTLRIKCNKTNGLQTDKPIEAYTSWSGLKCGYTCDVISIEIKKSGQGQLNYHINLKKKWSILGIGIISKSEYFDGTVDID